MLPAFMMLVNGIVVIFSGILIIGKIFNSVDYDILLLLFIFLISLLNECSLRINNKEKAKVEYDYFNLIKILSKMIKDEDFEKIYYYLRDFRKTEWYKRIDRQNSLSPTKNLNQFYDIDEYKIDYMEK